MILAGPTNDGQTMVIVYWPVAAFHEVRADIEGHFLAALDLAPSLAERVRAGTRGERFRGTADLPNFYRRPHGPGWALVGDAGYHKDPITAQGITDAFRDAELLADGDRRRLRRPAAAGGGARRLRADAERGDAAAVRADLPVRRAPAAPARDAAALRRPAPQPGASRPLHRHHRRHRPDRRSSSRRRTSRGSWPGQRRPRRSKGVRKRRRVAGSQGVRVAGERCA